MCAPKFKHSMYADIEKEENEFEREVKKKPTTKILNFNVDTQTTVNKGRREKKYLPDFFSLHLLLLFFVSLLIFFFWWMEMGKKRIVDVEKHVADRMKEKKNLDATQLNRNMRIFIHSPSST